MFTVFLLHLVQLSSVSTQSGQYERSHNVSTWSKCNESVYAAWTAWTRCDVACVHSDIVLRWRVRWSSEESCASQYDWQMCPAAHQPHHCGFTNDVIAVNEADAEAGVTISCRAVQLVAADTQSQPMVTWYRLENELGTASFKRLNDRERYSEEGSSLRVRRLWPDDDGAVFRCAVLHGLSQLPVHDTFTGAPLYSFTTIRLLKP